MADRKLNIVYVSSPVTSSFGGGEKVVATLIDGMSTDENSFIGGGKDLYELFESKGLKAYRASAGFEPVTPLNLMLYPVSRVMGLWQLWRFRELYRHADVIVAPTSFTEIFFTLPLLKRHHRVVIIIQNAKSPRAIARTFLKWIYRHDITDCQVVFVSETQRDSLKKQGMPIPDNSVIINNAVDVRPYQPPEGDDQAVRLGFIGRMHPEKRLNVLLEALAQLKPNQKIVVRIGGDGPAKVEWQKLAESLALGPNITLEWLGFVKEPRAFYEHIDALVLPTIHESSSLVIVEAWERGVPVLSSDIPIITLLKAKMPLAEQRLTFKCDAVDDLTAKLDYFLAHLTEYTAKNYKQSLHNRVAQSFQTLPQMVAAYRRLYLGED